MPPWAASCIRMASPSWRAPTIMTAISQVSGLAHRVTSAMAAPIVPQAWATSHIPRQELREVSRLHSANVKMVLGSTRATTGIGGSSGEMIRLRGCSSIRCARDDVNLRGQGAMHRAFVGDFQQPLALLGVEIALHGDHAVDLVEHASLGFAFGAIFRMDLAVAQSHRGPLQRQRLAVGVK